jgi:hypothetical protein
MKQITYLPNPPSEIDIRDDREKEIDQRKHQKKLLCWEITDVTMAFVNGEISSDNLIYFTRDKIHKLENILERIRILESM